MNVCRTLATLAIALSSGCSEYGDSCFAGSTRVATPRGPRPIRDLAIGDEVWSYDHVTRRFAIGRVTAIHRSRGAIRSLRSANGVLAAVTGTHPLFAAKRADFVAASAIAIGEELLHWDGDPDRMPVASEVLAVESPTGDDTVEVFNLTVGDAYSTFFADGFYVHNKEEVPPTCPYGPLVNLYVADTACIGAQKHVSVYGACEASQELLDSVVLATSDPSVIVIEGRTATAVGSGTATITGLVDGRPRAEALITVTNCAADAGVADTGTD
jgi:hypothetical protein